MTRRALTVLHAVALLLGVAACRRGAPATASRHHLVVMRGGAFVPDSVVAAIGDTITWRNDDVVPHTATGNGWDSGELGAGGTFTRVVAGGEVGRYACRYHPAMLGEVVAP